MKFTEDHEWLRIEGDLVVVGITEHASTQLGDVVFVELPEVGTMVAAGDEIFVFGNAQPFATGPAGIVHIDDDWLGLT